MSFNLRVSHYSASVTAVGAATLKGIRVANRQVLVRIVRLKAKRTAGTAASFTPSIHSSSTSVAQDITQEYLGTSTLIANLFDSGAQGLVCFTDSDGYLYVGLAPNAGADNAFDLRLAVEILT